jgi:hypothetical protein
MSSDFRVNFRRWMPTDGAMPVSFEAKRNVSINTGGSFEHLKYVSPESAVAVKNLRLQRLQSIQCNV